MRSPETAGVALVDVVIANVETTLLQQYVCINAHHRIAADRYSLGGILCGEHTYDRRIVGGIIACEEGHVATQFAT